ncbi:MAG TPA: hypothetical protein VJB02_00680 [Coxiellaceae bacterium]|nr:hypothetical protein [Coxiellaceae bacterium]
MHQAIHHLTGRELDTELENDKQKGNHPNKPPTALLEGRIFHAEVFKLHGRVSSGKAAYFTPFVFKKAMVLKATIARFPNFRRRSVTRE